jgi:hypothetical protein
MIYTLNIIDELNKKSESLRNWIAEHVDNPLFWLIMFGLGILVFFFTYNALQTEK